MIASLQHIADLLETFADYHNPAGELDPWFTLDEVARQFAGEFPLGQPLGWLEELTAAGVIEQGVDDVGAVWRWPA